LGKNRGGTPTVVRLALEARPCPSARQITIASVGVSPPNFSFFPFVIAGLDPAIHAEVALANASTGICRCSSAWTTGPSPVVTS